MRSAPEAIMRRASDADFHTEVRRKGQENSQRRARGFPSQSRPLNLVTAKLGTFTGRVALHYAVPGRSNRRFMTCSLSSLLAPENPTLTGVPSPGLNRSPGRPNAVADAISYCRDRARLKMLRISCSLRPCQYRTECVTSFPVANNSSGCAGRPCSFRAPGSPGLLNSPSS
jgi:hypothetical protein